MPWHGEGPLGNTLCQEHCHAVPQYCGWAGVLCCHPEHDLHPHRNGTSCRGTDVEHEVCPDNTTPGAVWKLDLTMQVCSCNCLTCIAVLLVLALLAGAKAGLWWSQAMHVSLFCRNWAAASRTRLLTL